MLRAHNQGLVHVRKGARRLNYALASVVPAEAPANLTLPTITGTPTVGETLTGSVGSWSNSPTSYARQWYADAVAISGATGATYDLTASEEGALITVGVVATNVVGDSAEAVSAAVGPVAAAPDVTAPTITSADPSGAYDEGVAIGGTLTADETVAWSVSGTDAAAVTLDAGTGVWSLEATDYETQASYSFTFTATDGVSLTDTQAVAITINDVVEGAISPPVLTLTSEPGANPPVVTRAIPANAGEGDYIQRRIDTASTYDTVDLLEEERILLWDGTDFLLGDPDTFEPSPFTIQVGLATDTTEYMSERFRRDLGDTDLYSDWSNDVTFTVYDFTPTAFSFVDQTDVAVSSTITSAAITVLGVSAGAAVPISVTGGEYEINANGIWTTSAGTVALNDTVKARHTSSAANLTNTDTVVTIGGVSDTFRSSTVGAEILPDESFLGMWFEAAPANLNQNTSGAGTAVASDGDPVGYWADLSAANFHTTAPANDTTRPLYKTDGSIHWVRGDGSNDILRRLADPGLWGPSGFEACLAIRSQTNAASSSPIAAGNTGTVNQFMAMGFALAADADNATCFWRNNSGVDILSSATNMMTDLYNEAWHVWQIVDTGSQVTFYRDGVAGAPRTYTRTGNSVTLNNFSMFGLLRTTASGWWAGDIAFEAIYPGHNLDSAKRAAIRTYAGNKVGLSL